MSYNKEVFENLHAPNVFGYVQTGDDTRHNVDLVGQISLQDTCGTTSRLTDVLYVPTIGNKGLSCLLLVHECERTRNTLFDLYIHNIYKQKKRYTLCTRDNVHLSLSPFVSHSDFLPLCF